MQVTEATPKAVVRRPRHRVPQPRFEALYAAGKGDSIMARMLGVSRWVVRHWRQKRGLPSNVNQYRKGSLLYPDIPRLYALGMTDREIADELICSDSTPSLWRRRHGLPRNMPTAQKAKPPGGVRPGGSKSGCQSR